MFCCFNVYTAQTWFAVLNSWKVKCGTWCFWNGCWGVSTFQVNLVCWISLDSNKMPGATIQTTSRCVSTFLSRFGGSQYDPTDLKIQYFYGFQGTIITKTPPLVGKLGRSSTQRVPNSRGFLLVPR